MKAAYIEQTGPPEVIRYGDLPTPQITEHQVLVRMEAVAVNPIDTYIRNGANYWPLPFPFVVGCDIAGRVEAVGSAVTRLRVGERVWGSNQGLMGRQGTFAEYQAIDECWLYSRPAEVTAEGAAACALVGITAHLGLFQRAQLRAGETVFVQGGSGGVGSMVVQMAKAAGARVIATAGSEAKAELCRALGADEVILHTNQDVVQAMQQIAPQGAHVVWETQREPNFDLLTSLLAERGRLVIMAGRDARPPFPVGPFYVKGCSLVGFVMFKASAEEQQTCANDINRWLQTGQLKPRIDRILPLSETATAHRLQEESTVRKSGQLGGKIVLQP